MSRWWAPLGIAAGLLAWGALAAGAWEVTFVLGLGLGSLLQRRLAALSAGGLAGLVGWGLPLLALALAGAPVGRAAVVISSVLGAPAAGIPALALTLLTGVLLAAAGAWLGFALRRLSPVRPLRHRPAR